MRKTFLSLLGLMFLILSTGNAQTALNYLYEEFNGYPSTGNPLPAGWIRSEATPDTRSFSIQPNHGLTGMGDGKLVARPYGSSATGAQLTAWVTTPLVNMGDNPVLKFHYRIVDYYTNTSSGGPTGITRIGVVGYTISISTDDGQNWNIIKQVPIGEYVGTLAYALLDLSDEIQDYTNQNCKLRIFVEATGGSVLGSLGICLDIDNLSMGTAPTTPLIVVDSPFNFGNAYNNLPFGNEGNMQIANNGAEPLIVTGFSSASPEISFSEESFPVTIQPFEKKNVTIKLNLFGKPNGSYTGQFDFVSNDPNSPTTVTVNGTANPAPLFDRIEEDFTPATFPGANYPGWERINTQFARSADRGINNSPCLRGSWGAAALYGGVQTPYINTGDNLEIHFWYRLTEGTAATSESDANIASAAVEVSKDNGTTWETVWTMAQGAHIPSLDYQRVRIVLGDEYEGEICLIRILFTTYVTTTHSVWLDDIFIGSLPQEPTLETPLPTIAFGNIYNNLPFNYTSQYTVRNLGVGTLTIADADDSSSEITLTGLPLNIETPLESKNFTVTLNPTNIGVGDYSGYFDLSTNDPKIPTARVNVTANAHQISNLIEEDFENAVTTPTGWIYTRFVRDATGGIDNSACLRVNNYGTTNHTAEVQTTYVNMGTNPIVSFYYKATRWNNENEFAPAANVTAWIEVSNDNGVTWDRLWTLVPGAHIPANTFTKVSVSANAYANHVCLVRIGMQSLNSYDARHIIDNITVGTLPVELISVFPAEDALVDITTEIYVTFNSDVVEVDFTGITINGEPAIATAEDNILNIENPGLEYETEYEVIIPANAVACYTQEIAWTFTTLGLTTFTITPTAGENGNISPDTPQTVNQGESKTFTFIPNTGYEVDEVKVDGETVTFNDNEYTFTNVEADHTIHVTFKQLTYTITPTAGANGTITPNTPQTVNHGGNITFTFAPETGFEIDVVKVDDEVVTVTDNQYTFTNVIANHTINITFKQKTYTITPSAGVNGSITPNTPQTVNHGGNITFTFASETGFEIDVVKVDDEVVTVTDNQYTFTNVVANHTINVTFKLKTYTITVSSNNLVWGTVEGGNTFEHGTTATVIAIPTEEGDFVNWTENGEEVSKDEEYTFPVFDNVELVANFIKKVSISKGTFAEFTIYPNPVKEELTIVISKTDKAKIEIYSLSGALVWTSETNDTKSVINVSTFPAGVYTIRLIENNNVSTQKFVKE